MKNKQQVIDFLTWLKWSSVMQISTLNSPIKFAEADWKSGIYFCWWLKQAMNSRCKDDDIWLKKYIAIDIDIRNDHFLKTWDILTQDQLMIIINEIVARLELKWYNDYCAMVDSGNWLHIYWTGKERIFDKDIYASWVKQLQSMINYIILDLWYICDPACTNLSRIMRLPWTINDRKKDKKDIKYDLWPIEAEILYFEPKDSETFESLELFAELYKDQEEKEKKELFDVKKIAREYKKWDDLWWEINRVPMQDVVELVYWIRQWADNGEIITLKEHHKNMWAYVYKPFNLLVSTWSSMIKTKADKFTCFELVCYELMWWDKWNTVKWFEEKFWIQTKKQPIKYEKLFSKIGYRYPWQDMENAFWCIVSGELVLIAAATNKGKTSFWLNILKQNKGKKVWLLNMEFEISDTFRFQFLRSKWYKDHEIKKIWTNLHPISEEEEKEIQEYIDKRMKEISTYNLPQNTDIDTVMEKLYSLWQEWYSMIMFDSLSSVKWWNTNEGQEEIVKRLRNFCTDTWIVVLLIHHFNKWGKTESGSQKISDLANVHINIHSAEDAHNIYYRVFILKKDKPHSKEIEFHWYMDLAWIYTEVPHWLQSNNFL